MRVVVRHHIGRLADDLAKIPVKAHKDMLGVVRKNLRIGNDLAKANARASSGRHGKYYPGRFRVNMYGAAAALSGGGLYGGEYGPSGHPQGEMSFEGGSRNQKPHRDLQRSLDVVGPKFADDAARLADGWFW